MEKIQSLDRFLSLANKGKGYICITDSTRSNKVHEISCNWITKENFQTKVITNNEKQGSYYWSEDRKELLEKFKGSLCNSCG